MTEGLTGKIRSIHYLERSIRVLELVRDSTQRVVHEATARYEGQGGSAETNPAVAKARAYIAAYNRAIYGAKARVRELEKEDLDI